MKKYILVSTDKFCNLILAVLGVEGENDGFIKENKTIKLCYIIKKDFDRIDFFVKQSKPISYFISNKTHITNEVLQQHGIDIHEALKKIKDYVKDLTLIAHNGIKFDYRFINNKLEQYGFEPLTNPIIDTMQLSRYLNEKATQHNLGTISRGYKLVYNDEIAHRADFDAAVLFEV